MSELNDEIRQKLLDAANLAAKAAKAMRSRDSYYPPEISVSEASGRKMPHLIGDPPKMARQHTVELSMRFDKFDPELFDVVPRDLQEDNDHVPMHAAGRKLLEELGERAARDAGALPDESVTVYAVNQEKGYVSLLFIHETPLPGPAAE